MWPWFKPGMRRWAGLRAICVPPTCIRHYISGRSRSGGWCSDRVCSRPACCRCCAARSRSRWSGSSPTAAPSARAVAMLLTLGCYGFVYTNAIARGFAMAEMLTLCGVVLLLGGRHVLAGACLGAALCCNYLAVFVGGAVLLVADAWVAILAVIPFLGLDAWFFVAQHAARTGQFPPFAAWPSLVRLAEYQVAAVFGGLPLYSRWGLAIRGESRARRGCRCAGSGRRPCQTAGSQSGARRGDRSTTGIVSSRGRVQHHAHRVAISDLRLAICRVVGSGEFPNGWEERPVCISYSPPVTSNRQHRWPAVFAADDATRPARRG